MAKKLLNDPHLAAAEMLDGLVIAYNGKARKVGAASIVWNDLPPDRVSLLVGGGSGHEPAYHGLVGENLAHGAACGDIFAAPPADVIFEAAQALDRGRGVLFLYGNYAGDVLNFDLAAEMCEEAGIEVRSVRIHDDVTSAPPERKTERRGISGLVPIVKIAGAAAARVDSLDELERLARKAVDHTRAIGIALSPGSIPATGEPTFEIADDEVGFGIGNHGEEGVGTMKLTTADEITERVLDLILNDDFDFAQPGGRVVIFVNSLGATTMMECLIVLRKVREILQTRGVAIHDAFVGDIVTCQEMAGVSISLTMLDDELQPLWDAPCSSVGLTRR